MIIRENRISLVSAYGPSVIVSPRSVVAVSGFRPVAATYTPSRFISSMTPRQIFISASNSGVPSSGPSPSR